MRPGEPIVDLQTWFVKNHGIGIGRFFAEEIKFVPKQSQPKAKKPQQQQNEQQNKHGWTPKELEREGEIWREYAASKCPPFYPGFLDVLRRFVAAGGLLVTCTHSEESMARRHFREQADGLMPVLVYGWTKDRSKMKPNPYPVHDVMERLGVAQQDILVLDDLSPGIKMGKAAGVATAAAGWGEGHTVPQIRDDMRALCDYYFATVADFAAFLFCESDSTSRS